MLWAWMWAVSAACGQVVHENGMPVYWEGGEPWVSPFVPPVPDRERLLRDDAAEAGLNLPFRFAASVPVTLNPKNAGRRDGQTWFCEVYAPGATCLAFVFDRFRLPPGGRFFVYTPDRQHMRGPFTRRNNNDHFAIAPLPGDRLYLEYTGPDPDFNIRSISYGYRDVFSSHKNNKDFGDAEPCHVNTVCPLAADWQDEKRGVAMILTDDLTRWCSASLINNVRQDGRPFLLTADHCVTGSVAGWVVMFNYESPTCVSQDGPTDQTVQGAMLRARWADSDFALLELNDRPQNYYHVYYNGWNNQDTPALNATVIHHPAGDLKKISFDYDPVVSSDNPLYGPPGSHWRVVNYEVAATAPGSSGSPLFDHQSRIVGQLHGGESWCNVFESDEYGKISYSWATNPQPNRRLKFWLDPDNTGAATLDGAYIPPQPVVDFSVSQNQLFVFAGCPLPTVQFENLSNGINNPTTYTWEFPGGTPSSFSGPHPPPVVYASPGIYDVRLTVCNPETCYTRWQTAMISVVESPPLPLPFYEDFESVNRWTIVNPDNDLTWRFDVATGANGQTRAAVMDFFNYQTQGRRDRLVSPPLDFSGVQAPITLEFDYAYCRYLQSTATDSLIVYATRNCGQSLTRIRAFGENGQGWFATRSVNGEYFVPQANEWCFGTLTAAECPSLDLSAFAGETGVQIVFETYNNYQNNLWLDNVRVSGESINPCPLTANFTVNQLSLCTSEELRVEYTGNASANAVFAWNFDGATVVSGSGAGPYVLRWSSPGNKTVRLVVSNAECSSSPYSLTVGVLQVSSEFEIMSAVACSGVPQTVRLSEAPISGASYFWSFDGARVESGSGAGPYQIVWNDGGPKTVVLDVATGSCTARTERTIDVVHIPKPVILAADFAPRVGQEYSVMGVTAENDVQYIWDFGGATATPGGTGSAQQTLVWSTDGLKSVTLRLFRDGCYSAAESIRVNVQKPAARNPPPAKKIVVYPRPASSFVVVEWYGPPATARLYDATGRMVGDRFFLNESLRLDTARLPEGLYFLQVRAAAEVYVEKIVVKKD